MINQKHLDALEIAVDWNTKTAGRPDHAEALTELLALIRAMQERIVELEQALRNIRKCLENDHAHQTRICGKHWTIQLYKEQFGVIDKALNGTEQVEASSFDIYDAYKSWPDDIKRKLSMHDLRRMNGWTPPQAAAAPDDVRVALDSARADLDYLFGRVAADSSFASVAATTLRERLDAVSKFIAAAPEAKSDSFIQQVPDHCDRITWRGNYYHLPLQVTAEPVMDEPKPCRMCDPSVGVVCEDHEAAAPVVEGLSDEEIDQIANDGRRNAAGGIYATRVYEFARAIEAAAAGRG